MLKQRIITALLLLPIALGGFFLLEGLQFALFIGAVITLGAWEWARLAGFDGQPQRCLFAALAALLCAGLFLNPGLAWPLLGLAIAWWLVATLLVLSYPRSSQLWAARPVRLLIGLLVLLPAWQGLVVLKQMPQGNGLILAVMVLVWAADIGAYFAGRAFGKRKLAPQVSPGKSWEGVFGGMLLCLLLATALGLYQHWPLGQLTGALLGTVVLVLISVVGDLNESMFKRQAGVKDSSNLLPGHGGILDRIDSLTAAIPLFAVLLWLAGWGTR
ncbi:phosphatidate cytidylyltransferase [Pseudomonas sp. N040]|uniref:phosphatidate cytidylyltransferase n=1 Tax=Pseudomonas sp. N040 TaxID=2785325 RepID=UPI0018A28279|nr:phosphatidate cytidylyltransferase [Pseudomonas sp. N040]MBF7729704.1 phosphatidate cytidylyltransferase [Pseudomonas sp. N040]MBW7013346.1 phosphatidate cytidylyltransferase [Pseudomonas sp. N040]